MTEREFEEQSRGWDWYDLINFCNDNGYDVLVENIYSDESRNDVIREDVWEYRDSWEDMYNFLDDRITEGTSCDENMWRFDSWSGTWSLLDDEDLQDYIDDLYEEMEFDEENEEIEESEEETIHLDLTEIMFGDITELKEVL